MTDLTQRAALVLIPAALALSGTTWAASTYREVTVKDGGTLTGIVKWSGAVPTSETIEPDTDKEQCPKHLDQSLIVDKETLGIKNAVVSIIGTKEGKKFAAKRVSMSQKNCSFDPHIVVVPIRGEVIFESSDPVTHNVQTHTRRNRRFNAAMPPGSKPLVTKRFVRADRIRVSCAVHSWMKGYILVTKHPYVAVTDERGQFRISDIPPGTYKVALWHEKTASLQIAKRVQDVSIKGGKTTTVNFTVGWQEKTKKFGGRK